jgi:hypothetical protein
MNQAYSKGREDSRLPRGLCRCGAAVEPLPLRNRRLAVGTNRGRHILFCRRGRSNNNRGSRIELQVILVSEGGHHVAMLVVVLARNFILLYFLSTRAAQAPLQSQADAAWGRSLHTTATSPCISASSTSQKPQNMINRELQSCLVRFRLVVHLSLRCLSAAWRSL